MTYSCHAGRVDMLFLHDLFLCLYIQKMRNIFLLLILCVLVLNCRHAAVGNDMFIGVTDSVCHYGVLKMDSGLASHRFWILNHSEHNLVILKITPSCSCMTANYCRDVVLKGDSLWVDVHFDTHNFKGDFAKTVLVKTTLGDVKLYLDGDVE